jgi:hypothetical protein
VSEPQILLSYDPSGPEFAITDEAQMPTIRVMAQLQSGGRTPATVRYEWKVTLCFNGVNCMNSRNRRTDHPEIRATTFSNIFTIPFTQVRGGELTIEVSARSGEWIGTTAITTQSRGLRVVGTNPSTRALSRATIMKDCFKRLMRHESGLQQFRPAACPYFSRDGLGGVGICQITNPAPTDDQVWSWKENLKRGLEIYKEKETAAKGYPGRVRQSREFNTLVADYNRDRVAQATPPGSLSPLTINLPDFTQDQLERATIRLFNGAPLGLHQYRVTLNGKKLHVNVDPSGMTGTAEWEEVTAADRIAAYDAAGLEARKRGDPNYVENVYRQLTF